MQTLTSRRSNRRRWVRFLGGRSNRLLVATAWRPSTAGAATTSNAPIGASGSVAALSGSSMEVQNPTSRPDHRELDDRPRTFSKTVSQAVSSLAAGDCVSVTGTARRSPRPRSRPARISVTHADVERLLHGFRHPEDRHRRVRGSPGGRLRRSGEAPAPQEAARAGVVRASRAVARARATSARNLASLSIASGKVTEVNGSTVTVSGTNVSLGHLPGPAFDEFEEHEEQEAGCQPKKEKLTITTSKSTTVSATQSASSTELAVGDCVSAFGPAATNGAVTATTVRITSTGAAAAQAAGAASPAGAASSAVADSGAADPRRVGEAVPKSLSGWGRAGHRRAVLVGAVAIAIVAGGSVAAWAAVGGGSAGYRMATVTRSDIATTLDRRGERGAGEPGDSLLPGRGSGGHGRGHARAKDNRGPDPGDPRHDCAQRGGLLGAVDGPGRRGQAHRGRRGQSSSATTTPSSSAHRTSATARLRRPRPPRPPPRCRRAPAGPSGQNATITRDQKMLTLDEATLGTDQQKEAADLAQAQTDCTSANTSTPAGQATCEAALETVSGDEQQVSKDQSTVSKDETAPGPGPRGRVVERSSSAPARRMEPARSGRPPPRRRSLSTRRQTPP